MTKKNPIKERDLRNPIKEYAYNDNENPDKPIKKGNPPFFQLYKGASFDFIREKMISHPKAMALWWELVSLMDGQGSVMIGQKPLATFFGVSRVTINVWVKWLEKHDLISIFKIGASNVYAVNSDIVSDQLITKKQHFALFNARVIAEKSEQTAEIKRKFFSVADSKEVSNQTSLLDAINEAEKK